MLIGLIVFFLIVPLCFTIPGLFLLKKLNYDFNLWENLILATVIGYVFFTTLEYFLLLANLHNLTIIPALIIDFYFLRYSVFPFKLLTLKVSRQLSILLLVFIIGIILQLLVIAPSGVFTISEDLVFYSAHGHDGPWHMALMNQIIKGFPLENPEFAGSRIVNYHFFSDLAPAYFNNLFRLSPLDLYFRFFPLLFSILIGGVSFILGKKIGGSFSAGIWATIFTYFCGSWGYLLTLARSQTIGGESIFWASQIQSSIGNPPQIASNIIVLTILIFIYQILKIDKKPTAMQLGCLTILVSSLIGFKVYASIPILLSLGFISLVILITKKQLSLFITTVVSGLLSLLIYLPNASSVGSFLIFEPWWFIRTMIVVPDRLNLLEWEHRRQTYISEHNYKRVLQLEVTSFLIFFFGNLGMRFWGLWFFIKKTLFKDLFSIFLLSICLCSLILPLLFLQRGVASNTIQFLQYLLLILGITSGVITAKLLSKIPNIVIYCLLSAIILLLMIPTQIGLIYSFYQRPPLAKISWLEISALNFLKTQTPINSVILTPSFNRNIHFNESTPPIWAWSDSAYISALSNRLTFFADSEQVDIMGYNFQQSRDSLKNIFETEDIETFINLVKSTKADYLYFPKKIGPRTELSKTNYKQIFNNEEIEIWSISPKS